MTEAWYPPGKSPWPASSSKKIEKPRRIAKNLEFSAKESNSVEGQRQAIKEYGRISKKIELGDGNLLIEEVPCSVRVVSMLARAFEQFQLAGSAGGGVDFLNLGEACPDSVDGEDRVGRTVDDQQCPRRDQAGKVGMFECVLNTRDVVAVAMSHSHDAGGKTGEVATRSSCGYSRIYRCREQGHHSAAAVAGNHDSARIDILACDGVIDQLHQVRRPLAHQRRAELCSSRGKSFAASAAAFRVADVFLKRQLTKATKIRCDRKPAAFCSLDGIIPLGMFYFISIFGSRPQPDRQDFPRPVAVGGDAYAHFLGGLFIGFEHVKRHGQFIVSQHVPAKSCVTFAWNFLGESNFGRGFGFAVDAENFQQFFACTLGPGWNRLALTAICIAVRLNRRRYHPRINFVDAQAHSVLGHWGTPAWLKLKLAQLSNIITYCCSFRLASASFFLAESDIAIRPGGSFYSYAPSVGTMSAMTQFESIVIFLPNWVGDVVMATPFLRAIGCKFPDAKFTLLGKPVAMDVLRPSDWVDDWIVDTTASSSSPASMFQMVMDLRRGEYDLAVLLPNSFRSALLAALAGIRRIAGYHRDGRGLLLTDKMSPPRSKDGRLVPVPMIDYYLALAGLVGALSDNTKMQLSVDPDFELAAEAMLAEAGADRSAPLVMLNPGGAFGVSKMWDADRYAAVADELVDSRGAGIIINAAPSEKEVAANVADFMKNKPLINFADHDNSIGLLKSLLWRCDLLVTNDTGARHIAAAMGVAVVTIYGSTDPAWTVLNYDRERTIVVETPCGPCQKKMCTQPPGPQYHQCMDAINPEMVLNAANELLDLKVTQAERAPK